MTASNRRYLTVAMALLVMMIVIISVSCRGKLDQGAIHRSDYQQAYVYAYPMIANYKAMYEFNIDKSNPQYKGPFNTVVSDSRTFTPKDTTVVTPNADTPYSMLQADLRAEPIVFCVPDIQKNRYYSVQLVDMYTFNYGYVGSRTTGNAGGCYLLSGPGWRGAIPAGMLGAFHSETQFSLLIYRTQLLGAGDIANVKKIQEGYTVQTLSAFTHQPPPPAPPAVEFPKFTDDAFKAEFPKYLNFLLQFCPDVAQETAVRLQFATIGIGPGQPFELSQLSPSEKTGLDSAIKDAYASIEDQSNKLGKNVKGWRLSAPFGNRDYYHGDYILRAAAAMMGIYGNDADEAVYPFTKSDVIGAVLDGSKHNYTLTFAGNSYPPVKAFWSVTMYDAKTQLLVENPINRYLISSTMLPDLKKNADGGVTIYLSKSDPGGDKKANWLPAPDGPVYLVMRLYWPRKSPPPSILPVTHPSWDPPGVIQVQ